MNSNTLEQLIEKGKIILTVLYEGDSPGSSGWIEIYAYQNIYYVVTDFEENYESFESFENALECEIFDYMRVSFELQSDTLSSKELNNIKIKIQNKSKQKK